MCLSAHRTPSRPSSVPGDRYNVPFAACYCFSMNLALLSHQSTSIWPSIHHRYRSILLLIYSHDLPSHHHCFSHYPSSPSTATQLASSNSLDQSATLVSNLAWPSLPLYLLSPIALRWPRWFSGAIYRLNAYLRSRNWRGRSRALWPWVVSRMSSHFSHRRMAILQLVATWNSASVDRCWWTGLKTIDAWKASQTSSCSNNQTSCLNVLNLSRTQSFGCFLFCVLRGLLFYEIDSPEFSRLFLI